MARVITRKKPKKNSIVIKTEMVPLSRLTKYYKNPRKGDVEKVAESLKANSQFKPIVVNVGTLTGRKNEILAGNHTFMGAGKLNWHEMLVSWVDVTNEVARKIVLADNGASDGSTYDDSILTELLMEVKEESGSLIGTTYSDDVLGKLVKDVTADPLSQIDRIEDAPDNMEGVADLNNDIIFPSDLAYNIPELLPDMIPDECPEPLDVWAGHELDLPRQEADPSIWWLAQWHAGMRGVNWKHAIAQFYTEDFHFDSVYTDPAKNTKKILNLGMTISMMPNYSITGDMPVALWVYSTYRSFYVARYFQEAGIKVIPDIQLGRDDEVIELSLLGIPQDVGVVSIQCQNTEKDDTNIRFQARQLKEAEDRLHFKSIIVYGHTDADRVVERAGLSCKVIRVANRSARRREYLNSGSTINSQKIVKKMGRIVVKK